MANVLLAYNNVVDGGTFSGGAWNPNLPLTNLQNTRLGIVARSVDAQPANTQFTFDAGATQKVRAIGFVNHNFSLGAQYRIQAYNDPGYSQVIADTGLQSVWPVIYPTASLEWEDDNYWAGTPNQKDITGYQLTLPIIFPYTVNVRYFIVTIVDSANPAGFVQFGRLFIGQAWQPITNPEFGNLSLAWETPTSITEALSGAEYFDRRNPYRVAKFTTSYLSEAEAYGTAFDIQRQLGVDGECMFMYNPDDTVYALRRQFYGRLRTLNAIEAPMLNINSTAWEVKERL